MEQFTQYIPQFIIIIGVLVAISNVIVQVLKKVLWDTIPTNLLAVVVSMVVTISGCTGALAYYNIKLVWYYIIAMVIVGFMVAYAAMFGFDKLKDIIIGLNISDKNKDN